MRKLILAIALIAAATTAAAADTMVSGNQSGTWSSAGSPYIITGHVTVPVGGVLTIQAGVTVKYAGHFKLIVNGRLDAQGTVFAPITFTRNAATDTGWGIRFVDATGTQSVMRMCVVEFMLADDGVVGTGEDDVGGGVFIKNSNVLIEQNTIRNNVAGYGGGVGVWASSSSPAVIRRNRITGNSINSSGQSNFSGGAGVGLEGASSGTTVNHNLIYGNSTTGINDQNFEGGGGIL